MSSCVLILHGKVHVLVRVDKPRTAGESFGSVRRLGPSLSAAGLSLDNKDPLHCVVSRWPDKIRDLHPALAMHTAACTHTHTHKNKEVLYFFAVPEKWFDTYIGVGWVEGELIC